MMFENEDDLIPETKPGPESKLEEVPLPDRPEGKRQKDKPEGKVRNKRMAPRQPTEDEIRPLADQLWRSETGGQPTSKETEVEIWLEAERLLVEGWTVAKKSGGSSTVEKEEQGPPVSEKRG